MCYQKNVAVKIGRESEGNVYVGCSLSFEPLGRPTVTAGSNQCFAHVVCPYVHPHFQNLAKQNKFSKTMFTTGETVGMAEWIIDVPFLFHLLLLALINPFLDPYAPQRRVHS